MNLYVLIEKSCKNIHKYLLIYVKVYNFATNIV